MCAVEVSGCLGVPECDPKTGAGGFEIWMPVVK